MKYGETALHNVAEAGFEEIVGILLDFGANIQLQDLVLIFFFF